MFRAFIAVDIEVKDELKEVIKKLKSINADLKVVKEENIHLTLKFLGEIEEELIDKIEEVIKKLVNGVAPFNMKLNKIGIFPNKRNMRIIWVGLENSENLVKIAKELENNLEKFGFKKEDKKFSPHITIARVRSARNINALEKFLKENENKEFYEVNVNSIKLKKSILKKEGAEYSDVRVISLIP